MSPPRILRSLMKRNRTNLGQPIPYNDLPLHARNTAWRGRGVFFCVIFGFLRLLSGEG